ncbi:fibronectin type III domain-containing protein [Flavobacterium sp.]|uniref:fibronectin type III domain-containing protein n=1 Tax=Flavobacterium sp. TaxID=239 RepID=UPI0038D13191
MKLKIISALVFLSFITSCSTNSEGSTSNYGGPLAPSNLIGEVISSTQINLSWTDNSTNETGFIIERKTSIGNYENIISLTQNITTYHDTGLLPGTSYTYRIKSFNNVGDSQLYSNEITLETPTMYMPLTIGNYWNYDVQQVNPGAVNTSIGIDHLFISNDTIINNVSYKKMKTSAVPNGFFSNTLRNNGLKIIGSSIFVTGSFNLPFPGLSNPIQIDLNNFTYFNENASLNSEICSTSGTLHQTVTANNTTYPLDIDYTLKSVAQETLPTYLSNSVTYSNVKKTRLILNLRITTTSSGITATLLADQPVLTMNEYFAKNIGNVYTNTYFHYDINSSIATQFSVPASISQTEEEFLTTYQVN